MNIDTVFAAPRWAATDTKCLNGQNKDRFYVSCSNTSHGHRIKLWDLGVTPTVGTTRLTLAANQPPPPLASPNQPPPFPMPAARAQRTICPTCGRQGNTLCRTEQYPLVHDCFSGSSRLGNNVAAHPPGRPCSVPHVEHTPHPDPYYDLWKGQKHCTSVADKVYGAGASSGRKAKVQGEQRGDAHATQ
ncbi:hypothetical protein B0H14DRAFT_3517884 [Mycena olivaceomarginata]|nr:hypothetical protein B0H14DRAFT_3517884 [Mycena olivaceomarginata]